MQKIKVNLKKFFSFLAALPKMLVLAILELYQILLSPDHSWLRHSFPHGYCKYYPSCSQYSKDAIGKHGLLKGSALVVKRVLRCHPWAEPKVDPVPNL